MAKNTTAQDVIDSFESGFADKRVLPESLEMIWLKKAVGRYSVELDPLNYDEELMQFDSKLDRYVIDTLAQFMLQMYQKRQVSLVNKRVSIVGKIYPLTEATEPKPLKKRFLTISYQSQVKWWKTKNLPLIYRRHV